MPRPNHFLKFRFDELLACHLGICKILRFLANFWFFLLIFHDFLDFACFSLIFHSFLKKQTVHVKFFKSGEHSTQFHSTLLSSGIAVLPTCVSCCSLLLGSVPERSHKPYVTCAEQFHVAAVCSEASSAVGHGPWANRIVCVGW